ncbi:uncharacterized protein B0H18DRAFT_952867 [Fomitopsis serialis]|uniref:uncharacterized protein n=1 Tax=Fomitopsis serialis TaxID=139415 RepID=UPI00200899B4|nr:uncharacterized protein B0H18DRAFT_952867 [Neoantrodia serialis]KAH9931382.1 hypothetical protein B0H18DRAFT_952867 [Neoantrodia serialis]
MYAGCFMTRRARATARVLLNTDILDMYGMEGARDRAPSYMACVPASILPTYTEGARDRACPPTEVYLGMHIMSLPFDPQTICVRQRWPVTMDRPAWSDRIRVVLEAAVLVRLIHKHTEQFVQSLVPVGPAYVPLTIYDIYQKWHEHMKEWLRIIRVRTITDPQPLNMLYVRSEIDRLEAVMIALANFITPLYRHWSTPRLPESLRIHTDDRDEWTHIARSTISLMCVVRETVDYWHIDAGILWQDPPIKRILYNHHAKHAIDLDTAVQERNTLVGYSGRFVNPSPQWFVPYDHINYTNEYEFFERICAHIALLLQERQLRIDREIEFDEDIHVWVTAGSVILRTTTHDSRPDRRARRMPEPPELARTLLNGMASRQALHCQHVYSATAERATLHGVNDRTYRGGGPSPEDVSKSVDLTRLAWFQCAGRFYQQCKHPHSER